MDACSSTCIISGLRLQSLTELDYSDITYNIPHALIFGSLEPSVGVLLACVPLLRPLLARSQYSSGGTAQYGTSNKSGATGNSKGSGGGLATMGSAKREGFSPLDDDSSQYQLRPLGSKQDASANASRESGIHTVGSDRPSS